MPNFVSELRNKLELDAAEEAILREANIRNVEELWALVYEFPDLGEIGLDCPKLSSYVRGHVSAAFLAAAGASTGGPPSQPIQFPCGAIGPTGVRYPSGTPLPNSGTPAPTAAA